MMKDLGVARRFDDMGRISLPIEVRKALNMENGSFADIYVEGDKVILRKSPETADNMLSYMGYEKEYEYGNEVSYRLENTVITITKEEAMKTELAPSIEKGSLAAEEKSLSIAEIKAVSMKIKEKGW